MYYHINFYIYGTNISNELCDQIVNSNLPLKNRFAIVSICVKQHVKTNHKYMPITYYFMEKLLRNATIDNPKLVQTYNNIINMFDECNKVSANKSDSIKRGIDTKDGRINKRKKKINKEHAMYQEMKKHCNNFNSYNMLKDNYLSGPYNPASISLHKYRNPNMTMYKIEIFKNIFIIMKKFRQHNFIHGDFHDGNILVDNNDISNIQIIDLENSVIMDEDKMTFDDDYVICMNTTKYSITMTKCFMFLYDMYMFIVTQPNISDYETNYKTYYTDNVVTHDYIILCKIFENYKRALFRSTSENHYFACPQLLIDCVLRSKLEFDDDIMKQRYNEIMNIMRVSTI